MNDDKQFIDDFEKKYANCVSLYSERVEEMKLFAFQANTILSDIGVHIHECKEPGCSAFQNCRDIFQMK